MRKKGKIASGVYTYLQALGLLENGTEQAIKDAKVYYWATVYKNEWRRRKRKENAKYEVFLNELEQNTIVKNARLHNMTKTRYIKVAALAYSNAKYVVPQLDILFDVKTLLSEIYDVLSELQESNLLPVVIGNEVLARFTSLESKVLQLLFDPNHAE